MTTLQILLLVLGGLFATALVALGWACLAIAKMADRRAEQMSMPQQPPSQPSPEDAP